MKLHSFVCGLASEKKVNFLIAYDICYTLNEIAIDMIWSKSELAVSLVLLQMPWVPGTAGRGAAEGKVCWSESSTKSAECWDISRKTLPAIPHIYCFSEEW